MRILLGGLILLALFSAAALWQRSWTSSARERRDRARSEALIARSADEPRWSRVIVGRPSGGEPFAVSSDEGAPSSPPVAGAEGWNRSERAQPAPQGTYDRTPHDEPVAPAAAEVVVMRGDSLSAICRAHYGTASADVLSAVARYNHIVDPGAVREGQRLRLPSIEALHDVR